MKSKVNRVEEPAGIDHPIKKISPGAGTKAHELLNYEVASERAVDKVFGERKELLHKLAQ